MLLTENKLRLIIKEEFKKMMQEVYGGGREGDDDRYYRKVGDPEIGEFSLPFQDVIDTVKYLGDALIAKNTERADRLKKKLVNIPEEDIKAAASMYRGTGPLVIDFLYPQQGK